MNGLFSLHVSRSFKIGARLGRRRGISYSQTYKVYKSPRILVNSQRNSTADIKLGSTRYFGGPLPDYEFTDYGLEIYRELYGSSAQPPAHFVIPADDVWPSQLYGRPLGLDVRRHRLINAEEK
jgi:hypothetical protein